MVHKSSLYPRLALMNIKNNRRFYYPFILTCILTIALFYIMVFIKTNDGIQNMPGADSLQSFMGFGSVIIGIFSMVFLFYTNSFLMKRRKKELGLFNILGMEKRNIAGILFWETVIAGTGSIALGLLSGILLSKLVLMLLLKILRFPVPFGFSVSAQGISSALFLFAAVFALILLSNLMQIRLSKPIELLKSGTVGQREPKAKLLITILGALSLGAGYAIAIITDSPLQAIFMFFIAVLLVIAGTYAFFMTGSITILKLLRKNRKYYYKTKHFISVSGMIYRMKQNAVGLANICILSTMVLVTLSTTVALYAGFEDILDSRFPSDISITLYDPDENRLWEVSEKVKDLAGEQGLEISGFLSYKSLSFAARRQGGVFLVSPDNYPGSQGACVLSFIASEEYEKISGRSAELRPDEVLVYSDKGWTEDDLELFDTMYTVESAPDEFALKRQESAVSLMDEYFIVVSDNSVLEKIYDRQASEYGDRKASVTGNISFDVGGSKEEVISYFNDMYKLVRDADEDQSRGYSMSCRQASEEELYSLYGGFLFLGIFLGSLFLMATVLIIYYKQITEGYSDAERYSIMQQIGMSKAEVRSGIRSQVMTVFFLPLIASCAHIVFAFSIITKLLALFELTNIKLFAICTVGTISVFAVFYAIIYAVTARVYYRIVS